MPKQTTLVDTDLTKAWLVIAFASFGRYISSAKTTLLDFTVKPVLSDHIKQDIFLAFQTGGCLIRHESSAESSCLRFLHYFHSAISNHLSMVISMSPKWMAAQSMLNCTVIIVIFGM